MLPSPTRRIAVFALDRIDNSSVVWNFCPPPSSTGSNTSGTGHRKPASNGESEKKPAQNAQA
jgi:hypothetical protein